MENTYQANDGTIFSLSSEYDHCGLHGTDHWVVCLKNVTSGDSDTFEYSQGSGWNCAEPQIKDVLNSLIQDAYAYLDNEDVLDLAANYGYDVDTDADREQIRKTWKSLQENYNKFMAIIEDVDLDQLQEEFSDY